MTTNDNETFTIPMEVRDASTGELKETIDFTFTREEIRNAVKEWRERERIAVEMGVELREPFFMIPTADHTPNSEGEGK